MQEFLARRLTEEPDMCVVSAVCDLARARIFLCQDQIDVVLLDFNLQGLDGSQLLQGMRPWPGGVRAADSGPAVLFCTGYADEAFEAKARLLGADGLVAKDRVARELIPAVRAVAGGGRWFHHEARKLSLLNEIPQKGAA